MDRDAAKKAAGEAAANLVRDGMCLGLGTGSTAAYALAALGRRIQNEDLDVTGIPTSFGSERLARTHGIPLTSFEDNLQLDLDIDGADEVDNSLRVIKGGGAAHSREKVVARQSARLVIVADPTKEVDRLGTTAPLPVEVIPMAAVPVMKTLESMGATPALRQGTGKDGPVVTDQGLWIVDAKFPDGIDNPQEVDDILGGHPGILDHGLFLDLATDVLVGHPDGSVNRYSAS